MEFILYVSTYFVTINQPLWFRRSTTIVQPTCIQSPLVPVWVGADRRNEQLQCLNHVGKPNFCELQTDSTRTTGKVRQIAKKIVLMLEASTASYLCICGLLLSMLLPSRQGKLLIKRIGKNRGNKNQLHRALPQCCGQLLFYRTAVGFLPLRVVLVTELIRYAAVWTSIIFLVIFKS